MTARILRPFTPEDAPTVAALITRMRPHAPLGPTELLSLDRDQRELGYPHGRLLMEAGGALLGFAAWSQSPGQYHPRRWLVEVLVAPEAQGNGMGTALYAALEEALRPLNPLSTRGQLSEDDARALHFATFRSYVEDRRYWTSALNVNAFDFAPYAELEDRLAAQGVTLTSAAELAARDPVGWRAQLHALFTEVRLDVPRTEPATPITLAQFTSWVLEDPGFIPEAYFLAVANGEPIGMSDLYRSEVSPDLMVGLTGVRRAWRGRGVALALKLRALHYAQSQGVTTIRTDNESGNASMLAINARLGFVRAPALLSVRRDWKVAERAENLTGETLSSP